MKKKIRIEYPLNQSSGNIIWNAISTTAGLERWFADKVTRDGKTFTFCWGKTETRVANMINSRNDSFIRFHWVDEEDHKAYFEIKILHDELTGDHLLEIIDFADEDEEEDVINLWNSQISNLRRSCGF